MYIWSRTGLQEHTTQKRVLQNKSQQVESVASRTAKVETHLHNLVIFKVHKNEHIQMSIVGAQMNTSFLEDNQTLLTCLFYDVKFT